MFFTASQDRFYHNGYSIPSFSVVWDFLVGCSLDSPVTFSIFLISIGIIRTFTVSLFLRSHSFKSENMGIKEIEVAIQKLELHERATLAKWIVESLEDLSEDEVEVLWAEEAERRLDEIEQGMVTEISDKDVLRRARSAIS